MLFLPKGKLPGKKTGAGYARGQGASGHWLRARASVVNTNTDAMSRWRHLFNVAKVNWKATQTGGRNTAPVLGITPAEAWLYQEATYLGILLAGLYEGDIQLQQSLIGTSSTEAYEVMVSTILAQMNQTTPIAPPITTVEAAASGSTVTATAGAATLAVSPTGNPQVGPISAAFSAALTISGFTMPAVPTPPSPAWSTSQSVINQFAMLPNSAAQGNALSAWPLIAEYVPGLYTTAVTGLPPGITAALDGIALGAPLWITETQPGRFSVTAAATAAPGTYQASFTATGPGGTISYNFVVTILDPSVYTLALTFSGLPANVTAAVLGYAVYSLTDQIPATLDGLPNGTHTIFPVNFNPSANTLTGSLVFLVTIDPSTPTGAYSFSAALSGFGTAPAVSPQFTATTIAQTPGQPCPPYQVATTVSAHTVCDGNWIVLGFELFPTYPSEFNDPSQPAGYSLAHAWTLTASPAYTSGYAAPLASTYRTILTTGPDLPTAGQVLAAWQDVFGPLPATGKMKIQLQWIDPLTGAPGPQSTNTLSWDTGTNKGVAKPAQGWPFPSFSISATTLGIIAPGDTSTTFTVSAGYNYTGAITFSLAPASYIGTGTPPGSDKLPTGLTGTFDNPVINFVNGVPDHSTVTLTLAAVAGAQAFTGEIDVQMTDSVITVRTFLTLSIVGVVTPQPPTNYLSMSPTSTQIYTPLSSVAAIPLDLFNSGPADMAVSMLTTNTDPDFDIEFGQPSTIPATATPTDITFALYTGLSDNALTDQYLSSAEYAPAGYNVTNALIIANTIDSVTVASTNDPAAMTVPGILQISPGAAATATATPTDITFAIATGAAAGELAGQYINTTGYAPAGYNLNNALILSNTPTSVTAASTNNPGAMTVTGIAAINTYSLTAATATLTEITFALATGASPGELIGSYLSSAGFAPAGYNLDNAQIVSNTLTTVTVASTNNPGTMTTAGIAAVIDNSLTVPAGTLTSPGMASITAFIAVGSAYTMPTPSIQIVASAGKNTTYSIVTTNSNPGDGFQISPLTSYVNQPVPGATAIPLVLSNTNPSPITATLTPYASGNGLTLTPSAGSVTIPAASGGVPGTATITVTITATAEADLTQSPAAVQAIAGGYSQVVSIWFTDTQYGPLYLSLSPFFLPQPTGPTETATLTVNNASAASATVTLTPNVIPSGITFTITPSTITLTPGTTSSPTTATATVSLGGSNTTPHYVTPLAVEANATGYEEVTLDVSGINNP